MAVSQHALARRRCRNHRPAGRLLRFVGDVGGVGRIVAPLHPHAPREINREPAERIEHLSPGLADRVGHIGHQFTGRDVQHTEEARLGHRRRLR
ncbi:hypothetical protein [Flexivirga oryzae]|uniref:hypothetical protein n=1 Tax=Flexivirga oryzae TaxID=1794944 RepID=UPI0016097C23|nr:hypothetical protein [Flexivirga oryzae]